MKYESRVTAMTVAPENEPLFSEMATTVSIKDEAAGEFVVVEQVGHKDAGKIRIASDEWPEIRAAIDQMIAQCRDEK